MLVAEVAAVVAGLKADIEALKAAKLRLMRLWNEYKRVTKSKRDYQRVLAERLEQGDDMLQSYATWSMAQFSELPEHMVRAGTGNGRYPERRVESQWAE